MSKLKYLVPNAITLSSLFCGFSAIVFAFNNELRFAFLLILIGSVLDFLDGLSAKLLDAKSEIGAQLDSLCDMVTFGIAPAVMVYVLMDTVTAYDLLWARFEAMGESYYFSNIEMTGTEFLAWNLKESFTVYPPLTSQDYGTVADKNGLVNDMWTITNGLHLVSWKSIAVAVLIPFAGALRLAKFNVKASTSGAFEGLAIPGAGLFVASIPVVIEQFYLEDYDVGQLLNKYLIAGFVLLIAVLMVLPVKMFSFKLKSLKWKDAGVQYIFLILCIPIVIACLLIKNIWLSVPLIVLLYLTVSVINNLIRRDEV